MASHRSRVTPGQLVLWVGALILCTFGVLFAVAVGGQIFYVAYHLTANADSAICQPSSTPSQTPTPTEEPRAKRHPKRH